MVTMKKLTLGGLALAVSLGSLSPTPAPAEPASGRTAEPGAPMACGAGGCGAGGCGAGKCSAGKCGGKPAPAASTPVTSPGADSKCGAGRCAPGRCGAPVGEAPSPRQPGPPLGPGEPAALLARGKTKIEAARAALTAEDKAAALAAFDALVEIGATLSRFDPATAKVPEALIFGRLEALKLNTKGSRSLAEGGHWRAARGSLKQLGQVFDGLYEPLGIAPGGPTTGTAPAPATR